MDISKANTLIISNEDTYTTMMRQSLLKIGLVSKNIYKAENANRAIHMTKRQLFAIIFLDIGVIDDDTNARCIDDIQTLTKKNETKIVAYSDDPSNNIATFVEQNELDGYLTKPIYVDDVRKIMLKILEVK